MYRPDAWKNTLLPGVFFPYDLTYVQLPPQPLANQDYLIKKHRRESPSGYPLNLGSFVQFALECFPVLCSQYQIPSFEEGGEHLLELYLRACYGKRFRADRTTFRAEGERGIRYGLPQWAQRWMMLWHELPAGMTFGKEEVLAVLDCLWNTLQDARGIFDAAVDDWLYGAIYGPRDQ